MGCGVVGGKIERGRREGPRSDVALGGGELAAPGCGSSIIGVDEI